MLLIPKTLIDEYFKCKYIYYKNREEYNSNFDRNINSFEYYIYLNNSEYYKNLSDICNKIKTYIKNEIDRAIKEENEKNINVGYKYYKLSIKYACDWHETNYYVSPMIKSNSLLKVYKYLLFDERFDEIKLFDALICMTDCFNISKIREYDEEYHTILWQCDSFKVNDINVFAEYDNTLRNRYESIYMELKNLNVEKKDLENFNDITFKYPKSENDKCAIRTYINRARYYDNVLSQLYKCNEVNVMNEEYYDLMEFLNNFFVGKDISIGRKIYLETYEENQVYVTI